MFSYLNGTLAEKFPASATLDVNGVGFHLTVPLSTSQQLPKVGERVKLLVHHVVREDAELLFGFATEEERSLFRLLIGVSGIGPKLAMTVLSGLGIGELKHAIVQGLTTTLASISGIGRKTAERLIVELREKIFVEGYTEGEKASTKLEKDEAYVEDSLRALISLGYTKQNARAAIQKVLANRNEKRVSPEVLIRESLKYV